MFNLQFTEVIIILVLALVLLGPKKLPQIAKSLGQGLKELRRASDELKGTWEAEVQSEVRAVRDATRAVDAEWRTIVPDPPARGAVAEARAPEQEKKDEEPAGGSA